MEDNLILLKEEKLLKLLNDQRWDEVIQYVNREIQNNQSLAPAYFIKSLALQQIDQLDEAELCNKQAYEAMQNLFELIGTIFINPKNHVQCVLYCIYGKKILGYHFKNLQDNNQIIDICNLFLEQNQNYFPLLFLLAESYYKIEDYELAQVFYDMILQLNSTSLFGLLGKGKSLYKLKNYDQALLYYELGFQNHPLQKQSYLKTCKALEKQNKFQQSLLFYDLLYQIDSRDKNIYYRRGNALKEVNDFEGAVHCYNKVIELDKQYQNAYIMNGILLQEVDLAYALAKISKSDEALQILENILKSNPKNFNALFEKGIVLLEMNHLKQAKICFKYVLTINQDFFQANLQLGKMIISKIIKNRFPNYLIKDLSIAKLCKKDSNILIKISFKMYPNYNYSGQLLRQCYQYQEAIELITQAEIIFPNHLKILDYKCKLLISLQYYNEARDLANQIIKFCPNQGQGYKRKQLILNSIRNFPEALINVEKAITFSSIKPSLLVYKANILNNLGYTNEALNYYEKALALDPEYFNAHANKSQTLLKIQKYDEALQEIDFILKKKSKNPQIYFLKAQILFSKGDFEAAKIYCEQALEIEDDYQEAKKLKSVLESKGLDS